MIWDLVDFIYSFMEIDFIDKLFVSWKIKDVEIYFNLN